MSLRQLQRRSAALLRDGGVLRALRSELNHELSSSSPPPPDPSQSQKSEILVDEFALEWDSPRVQDVVLRRRHGGHAEEDISVSALLAPLRFRGEDPLPRDALMKVCIKKPQFGPVLHFDCRIFHRQEVEQLECGDSDFIVKGVYYHPSVDSLGDSKYKGPIFSSLDPQLQTALKHYLVARGIDVKLTSFLLQHLHKKEHGQYVNWLRALEGAFAKDA
ncbi:uncharacterized protein [Typha angustifolia]|uniref:uncharacterized protein isoform X1 n=1 Tax=Typha angustifolia TaxID=59011 RepID=UPI003C2D9B31